MKGQPVSVTILEAGIRDGETFLLEPRQTFVDLPTYPPVDVTKAGSPFAPEFVVVRYELMLNPITNRHVLVHPGLVKYLRK